MRALRHPLPADIEWIDDALDEWPSTLRWDLKGFTPPAPSLASRLWDGVATQRVVSDGDGRACGLLQLVDLNLVNGTARLEAIVRSPAEVVEAFGEFVAEVFADFALRAGYVFAIADGLDAAVVAPGSVEVGRLRGHHLRGLGRYEDLVIHEIRWVADGGSSDGGAGPLVR